MTREELEQFIDDWYFHAAPEIKHKLEKFSRALIDVCIGTPCGYVDSDDVFYLPGFLTPESEAKMEAVYQKPEVV